MQQAETQTMLYRARLQLEEGQVESALKTLSTVRPTDEKTQRDVAYLVGWSHIHCKRWKEAIQALSPLIPESYEAREPETQLERERIAYYLLYLGIAASNVGNYEDASHHFAHCLKILHDKRVHLPSVRIQARYSLATSCSQRGLYDVAIQHYTHALRLCRYYQREDELADIHHGLCEVYREMADYTSAYASGLEALHLYEKRSQWMMGARMHRMLGRISFLTGNYREASDHYTEAVATATSYNSPTLVMVCCASLAELRRVENRLEEAKRYSHLALSNIERSSSIHMRGWSYLRIGEVTYADAMQADHQQRQKLLEDAVAWFEKAKAELAQTQAYADIAHAYRSLGQALEDLGRMDEAIACLRSGYGVLSH